MLAGDDSSKWMANEFLIPLVLYWMNFLPPSPLFIGIRHPDSTAPLTDGGLQELIIVLDMEAVYV